MSVPRIANVTMAPKFEKNGFYKEAYYHTQIEMNSKSCIKCQYLLPFISMHQIEISKEENHETYGG